MNISKVIEEIKSDPLIVPTGRVQYRGVVLNRVQESMFRTALMMCVVKGKLTEAGAEMGVEDAELVEEMVEEMVNMNEIGRYR